MDHQKITCHMIFDVKMEDFRRKARFVAGGHKTEVPKTITYASVVSRETVRLALLLASLNDLEVKAADIMNAYITAPVTEKIWCVLGPEFGGDAGKTAIIVRALYGLKSAGAAFRAHLASAMRSMGYESCRADPDLWMKKKTRPEDKFEYYSYILCYVDDILCCDHDASEVMRELGGYFALKPGSVGTPSIYLGAKLSETTLDNGVRAWGMSSSKYVQESVKNCKAHVAEHFKGRYRVPAKAENPFPCGYEPELDVTPELGPEEASYYQSNHAGDKKTRRSRTGYMIFANQGLVQWLSKKQPTVETSVFGAEFVAMKNGMECLRGIRYKLRMMGVPVDYPSYIFGDNMSVVHNTQRPESVLKKKSNSICYHAVREAVAMGECLTGHISTHHNYADLLTKVLSGEKRRRLVGGVLYDIYDEF
ncbi:LOW QUALITY PROTEIN: hypothetical protein ACHAWF_008209 [Thalassiosira exigua]